MRDKKKENKKSKKKFKWEKPVLIPLSAETAYGGCGTGSVASGNCRAGGVASNQCGTGVAPK